MQQNDTLAVPGVNAGLLIGVLGALAAFGAISVDMYLPSLPSIADDLGVASGTAQFTLSSFFIGFGLGQLFYGPLSDRFGRRGPLLSGILLYMLASLGCAFSTSLGQLIGWRFVQAGGGCAGAVIARAIVRDLYSAEAMARVMSMIMLVIATAPLVAPLIGGYLLVWLGWRAIFWLLAGFGALCFVAAWSLVPETRPREFRSRLSPTRQLAGYAQLLRHRSTLGYMLCGGSAFAGMFAYISGTPFVYIELFDVEPQHYGWLFGLNVAGLMLVSFLNSRLVGRLGSGRLLGWGLLIQTGAGLALLAASRLEYLPALVVPLFFYVSMIGIVAANATAGALSHFPELAGTASALFGVFQFGLGALAGALVGWLYDGSPLPMAGVITACGVLALISYRVLARSGQLPP